MLSLSEARMDFILEMYAKDHPKEFRFLRMNGQAMPQEVNASWANKLTGKSLEEFENKMIPVALRRALALRKGMK